MARAHVVAHQFRVRLICRGEPLSKARQATGKRRQIYSFKPPAAGETFEPED